MYGNIVGRELSRTVWCIQYSHKGPYKLYGVRTLTIMRKRKQPGNIEHMGVLCEQGQSHLTQLEEYSILAQA